MATQLQLCYGKVPLYLRFGGIFGLLSLAAVGPGRWATFGRAVVLLVLLRRWWKCFFRWPSRVLVWKERPLEPSVEGLHKRFVELYLPDAEKGEGGEYAVLGAQKKLQISGQTLAFWDVGPRDAKDAVLVCNGLGARVMTWAPLLTALRNTSASWAQRRLVIFDYRGQFDSVPLQGEISVERSAKDAAELADHLKLKRCILLCWSTGVQIGLQLALDRPDLVAAMVLIQGTTGEAMKALLQPLCQVPGVPSLLDFGLQMAPRLLKSHRQMMHGALVRHRSAFERLGSCLLWFFGSDLIAAAGVRYTQDMLQSDEHFVNYCRYALALGRHKIFSRLPDIKAPAFVVTGTPDFITPARCSYDMAVQLGGPTNLLDDLGGSHYYIYEEPQKLAQEMAQFLERCAPVKA
ncbi:unnamed protein product [Durusdinium trenchii]|uniref:AB hydrolase-1 domain-containing protein n=1 Tax=Durusdinium trenchii TaxID=1381693 RepID=A0ABP0RQ35_9DINO